MDAGDLLAPSNVLDLAVLGVASERTRTTAEIVAVVKRIGGTRFQPTADVIAGPVGALAAAGLLAPEPAAWGRAGGQGVVAAVRGGAGAHAAAADDAERLAGRRARRGLRLPRDLLSRPARAGGRDAVVDDLMTAHRRALHQARAALTGCPCPCAFVQRYLAREVERWEAEVGWLEALAGGAEAMRPWRP